MLVDEYLNVHVRAIDEATGTLNKVSVSVKDQMLAFNNLATAAFSLYNSYDRIQTAEVALDRANLMVNSSTKAVADAQKKYDDALRVIEPDAKAVAAAQDSLAEANRSLADATASSMIAQQDLNSVLQWVSGSTDDLELSTKDMVWATADAEDAFNSLNATLNESQMYLDNTTIAMQGLNAEMESVSRRELEVRLEQAKLKDAFEDGTITEEEYENAMKPLDDEMRSLNIQSMELKLQIDDLKKTQDEQTEALKKAQEKVDTLVDANNKLVDTNNQLKNATDASNDAQTKLNTALETGEPDATKVKEALANLQLAQERLEVATERAQLAQGNLNQSMVSTAVSIIPTSITAFTSLSTIFGAHATAAGGAATATSSLSIAMAGLAIPIAAAAAAGLLLVGTLKLVGDWAKAQYDSLNKTAEQIAIDSNMMDNYTESIIDNNKALAAQAMLKAGVSVEEIARRLGGNYLGTTSEETGGGAGGGGETTGGGTDINIDIHDNDIASDIDKEQLARDIGIQIARTLRAGGPAPI